MRGEAAVRDPVWAADGFTACGGGAEGGGDGWGGSRGASASSGEAAYGAAGGGGDDGLLCSNVFKMRKGMDLGWEQYAGGRRQHRLVRGKRDAWSL